MPPNEDSVGLFLRHLIKKRFLEKEKDKSTHWKLQLKNKIESLIWFLAWIAFKYSTKTSCFCWWVLCLSIKSS